MNFACPNVWGIAIRSSCKNPLEMVSEATSYFFPIRCTWDFHLPLAHSPLRKHITSLRASLLLSATTYCSHTAWVNSSEYFGDFFSCVWDNYYWGNTSEEEIKVVHLCWVEEIRLKARIWFPKSKEKKSEHKNFLFTDSVRFKREEWIKLLGKKYDNLTYGFLESVYGVIFNSSDIRMSIFVVSIY
jgi:hypothetical protein